MHFDNILSNKSKEMLPLSTTVVSSFGVHTNTFLVTAIEPFLSLSVSLSVVHTDFCTTKKITSAIITTLHKASLGKNTFWRKIC